MRLLAELVVVVVVLRHAQGDASLQCVSGPFHKPSPSKEVDIGANTACGEYVSLSCCPANVSDAIDRQGDRELYNFHWDDCGTIPDACEQYLKAESCFFECDPYLGPWKGKWDGTLNKVPICASYCDQWFEACKDVRLCAANWITDFEKNSTTGRYHCINDTCQTFTQFYQNGKGLCEIMWGDSFQYVADNQNCMVMKFEGDNPNAEVTSGATHIACWQSSLFLLLVVVYSLFQS
ncbi:riboflavin-binding protein-like [Corticium candelabrum]|uniref:riboflavin-binding protein-like n=1 Tax=Corticium candelabrum TaxID=121492 RepID=UPI002E25FEAF|nr:riboflavin-binding protein-like [Corticium candelabrum]